MGRARAHAVALVNWRGCFYERYELDREVTSLEGNNGAGKTTVMIAVYVVLLPEVRLLRFAGSGEGVPSGDRGLASRLGETGPAYSVIELAQPDGERLIAGVHLDRTSDTRAELNPFLVEGIGWDVPLAELMLTRTDAIDQVPEPDALKRNALKLGGRLLPCTNDEYFRELFDRGILPLRMASFEERTRFNLVLHTSMFGGMSTALQNGLRDFLLREDRLLGDTVQRMRRTLDECRRSRRTVEHNRRLHVTIDGIFRAGWAMFAAGFHSTRLRAGELETKWRELDVAARRLADVARERAEVYDAAKEARGLAVEKRTALADAIEEARVHLAHVQGAFELDGLLAVARPALTDAEAREEAALRKYETAVSAHREAVDARDRLAEEVQEVSRQLADLTRAYEDLAAKVGLYRAAVRAQGEATTRVGALVDASNLDPLLTGARSQQAEHAKERDRLEDVLRSENQRAERFNRTLVALERIVGRPVAHEEASSLADSELERLRLLDRLISEAKGIPKRLEAAKGELTRQSTLRRRVAELAAPEPSPATAEGVRALAQAAERAWEEANVALQAARTDATSRQQVIERRAERLVALGKRFDAWRRTHAALLVIGHHLGSTPGAAEELASARSRVTLERDRLRDERTQALERVKRWRGEAKALRDAGGKVAASLEAVRDAVGGSFVAEYYDDVPLGEAARLEARLGPLTSALLVEDVRRAAETAVEITDRPDTIWFVRANAGLPEADFVGEEALVRSGTIWRLSRAPSHPTIGRAARDREAQRLDQCADLDEREAASLNGKLDAVSQILAALDRVDLAEVGATDPEVEWKALDLEQQEGREALRLVQDELAREATRVDGLRKHRNEWNLLLPDSRLVEPPEAADTVRALESQVAEATRAGALLARHAADRTAVANGRDHLLVPPLGPDEIAALTTARRAEAEHVARQTELVRALDELREVVHALEWAPLVPVLKERAAASEALRARLESVSARLDATKGAVEPARDAERHAGSLHRDASVEAETSRKEVLRLESERQSIPIKDAGAEAVAAAKSRLRDLRSQHDAADGEVQRCMEAAGRAETEWERAEGDASDATAAAGVARDEWRPWEEQWADLRTRTDAHGLLSGVMDAAVVAEFAASGVGLARQASTEERTLHDRLRGEADAGGILDTLEKGEARAVHYLETWLAVRRWLMERLPTDLGETGDPLQGLSRLAERLRELEGKLAEKEDELKTSARSVADNLRARVRNEIHRVHKLNEPLRAVGFGTIRGIELVAERITAMDRMLDRLRDPDQQDLFRRDTPIEEALSDLFEEVGGGRIKGQRLLDYREYLQVRVRVSRAPSGVWEFASSRMSTGEAIGVGAGILMVVLAAWERDATVLRSEKRSGTLRFLFLDEANRLSPNSLHVLFDLCERLQLQLLIAAPDVARVSRGTTYHLTRTEDEEGRETIVASGRRISSAP